MGKRYKVLIVKETDRPFIDSDIHILQKHFDVSVLHFSLVKKDFQAARSILQIIEKVLWADLVFVWFASSHAYYTVRLSKIFRKKSVVVVGGYEVAAVPAIGYGAMLNKRLASQVLYVLGHADRILAVSNFSKAEILQLSKNSSVDFIYNGIDVDRFSPDGAEKEDLVITVGYLTYDKIKLKGIDTFIQAAKRFPDTRFMVIGECSDGSIDQLRSMAPKNVEFIDHVDAGGLIKLYRRARVYCQLSLRESFGVALAEAMSCECVPVVTCNAALPEVVGDTGFYAHYGDVGEAADAIEKALRSQKGGEARKRIVDLYSLKTREIALTKEIEDMLY